MVAGCVAILCRGCVQLLDLDTGAQIASFNMGSMSFRFRDMSSSTAGFLSRQKIAAACCWTLWPRGWWSRPAQSHAT